MCALQVKQSIWPVYTQRYLCTRACTYTHICTHTCIPAHIQKHTHTHIHLYTHTLTCIHMSKFPHMCTHTHSDTHTHTQTHTHIHTHTNIYTLIHRERDTLVCELLLRNYEQSLLPQLGISHRNKVIVSQGNSRTKELRDQPHEPVAESQSLGTRQRRAGLLSFSEGVFPRTLVTTQCLSRATLSQNSYTEILQLIQTKATIL